MPGVHYTHGRRAGKLARQMAMAYKYKILTVFICGVLLLFFLSGCDRTAPRINQLKPGSVILAFGDSLTSGVGAGIDESYPESISWQTR